MVEKVKDHMDSMCCAVKPDGTEECAAKYCLVHVKRTMAKRATHVARKMTEAEHPLYDAGDDFSVYDGAPASTTSTSSRARSPRASPGRPSSLSMRARRLRAVHHRGSLMPASTG